MNGKCPSSIRNFFNLLVLVVYSLAFDWGRESCLLVPPVCLIPRVILIRSLPEKTRTTESQHSSLQDASQTPRFLTHEMGSTSTFPSLMWVKRTLASCCLEPISTTSVLSSFDLSLSLVIHTPIVRMQSWAKGNYTVVFVVCRDMDVRQETIGNFRQFTSVQNKK